MSFHTPGIAMPLWILYKSAKFTLKKLNVHFTIGHIHKRQSHDTAKNETLTVIM